MNTYSLPPPIYLFQRNPFTTHVEQIVFYFKSAKKIYNHLSKGAVMVEIIHHCAKPGTQKV